MCGIIAFAGVDQNDSGALKKAIASLAKRGPDDSGIMEFTGALLGHTRLSIIDLSTGHQPMQDTREANAIVFNGEIYNYKALRKDLEQKGHAFATHSDTEVILKCYAQYGEKCPEYLDGQFAFALWDTKKGELFMARDRFGEKPLYIAQVGSGVVVASEIKALLATGLIKADIDPVSLDNYLALLYVPPWRSIYKNISPLPPAHRGIWKAGTLKTERYWQLRKVASKATLDAAAKNVRDLLTQSVRSRMIADVEVGAFLSGGIDSSIVARLAAEISSHPLKTFSAGFEGFIDELPYAKEIAELAKTDHYPTQVDKNLAEIFLDVCRYFDEPFGDSSNIPTSIISSLAREKVKVALSGDGGDELFWGYGQYTHFNHLPKLRSLLNSLTGVDALEHYKRNILTHFSVSDRKQLLKDSAAIEDDPTRNLDLAEATTPLDKINLIDFYLGLPGDMLTKVDRASMMHSLEVRSPFLHPELAELAYNLPPAYKIDGRRGKIILEKAFGDLLPQGFFTRKKQGFGAPVGKWLLKPEFKKLVDEWMTPDAKLGAFLDMSVVKKYLSRFYGGDTQLQYKIWILLALEGWLRTRI
jgi:asparagine synthase (glutamine-hydrolysing)